MKLLDYWWSRFCVSAGFLGGVWQGQHSTDMGDAFVTVGIWVVLWLALDFLVTRWVFR